MKLFVTDQDVYFMSGQTLYKTQMDCYGFCDLDEGEIAMGDEDQMERIKRLLVPVQKAAQDVVQLTLF